MSSQPTLGKTLSGGFCGQNPVLKLALGLCPALAVTTTFVNGFAMGLAATFVLIMSSLIVSLIRKFIPASTRLPIMIVVIATFVTIVQLVMAAYLPDLNKVLGIFIPLIVVNCMILGRAEAFARKNKSMLSFVDAVGMGFGFLWILSLVGLVREILGAGKAFGVTLFPEEYAIRIFGQPAGGFLVVGIAIALFTIWEIANKFKENQESKEAFGLAQKEIKKSQGSIA
ncbi:MAG: electron transport complex subunit RsxE [Planctomycetes bacterium]|nr:electron transport complex subunit RsxE [Planctomycetota bacterium]